MIYDNMLLKNNIINICSEISKIQVFYMSGLYLQCE